MVKTTGRTRPSLFPFYCAACTKDADARPCNRGAVWRALEGLTTGCMLGCHVLAQWQNVPDGESNLHFRLVHLIYLLHWLASMWYHWHPNALSLYRDYLWIFVLSAERLRAYYVSAGAIAHWTLGTALLVAPTQTLTRWRIPAIGALVMVSTTAFSSLEEKLLFVGCWGLTYANWLFSYEYRSTPPLDSVFTIFYHAMLGISSWMESNLLTLKEVAVDSGRVTKSVGVLGTLGLFFHVLCGQSIMFDLVERSKIAKK